MRGFVAALLSVAGLTLLALAGYSSMTPSAEPYVLRQGPAPADSASELSAYGVGADQLEQLEVISPDFQKPVANAIIARGADNRPVPLLWRNHATEPVFFEDLNPEDEAKVLSAIKQHVGRDAVVLAWWDFSRRIRAHADRQAPLDDMHARGLLIPNAWKANSAKIEDQQGELWGGSQSDYGEMFQTFIEALLADEERGASMLAEMVPAKSVFVALRLYDVWRLAVARPERLSIAYKDFVNVGDAHGAMKAVRDWMRQQRIEAGYAVEPEKGWVRVHYLPRPADAQLLLTRLLPFSTSNPLALTRLQLVYQYKGYWIYELKRSP